MQLNYWRQTTDAVAAPVVMQQGTGDYQYYAPETFKVGPIDDAVFALPSYCNANTKCSGSCARERAAGGEKE